MFFFRKIIIFETKTVDKCKTTDEMLDLLEKAERSAEGWSGSDEEDDVDTSQKFDYKIVRNYYY